MTCLDENQDVFKQAEGLLHLDSTNGSNWLLRCKEVRLGRSLACQPHQSSAYLCFLQGRNQTMPPTPAPQPTTKLPVALHHHIHSSSSVLLENWEGRGDRSTHGPSSLPAQGQELTDTGPTSHLLPAVHHEFPHDQLQVGRKAHYQACAEDFYTHNFASLKTALNYELASWFETVSFGANWKSEVLYPYQNWISSQRADHGYTQTVIYPVVPELLCGCHMSLCEVTCHIIVMVTCHHITVQLSWTYS